MDLVDEREDEREDADTDDDGEVNHPVLTTIFIDTSDVKVPIEVPVAMWVSARPSLPIYEQLKPRATRISTTVTLADAPGKSLHGPV